MNGGPHDEALASDAARARIDALRERAQQVAAARNEAYAAYADACRRAGELDDAIARVRVRAAAAGPCWRPGDTIVPGVHRDSSAERVDVSLLRAQAARWKQVAAEHDARGRELTRRVVDLTAEANVLEAREAERFRTGLLLSPDGSILPPRIVTRPPPAAVRSRGGGAR